jgi:hypothetical protein
MTSTETEWPHIAAVEAAKLILAGELGVIEGSRLLADLAHALVPDWTTDQDFVVFGALASDTDHLPTGTARQYWAADALAREDRNIARIEASARSDVLAACRNVIDRFQGPSNEHGASA